MSSLQCISLDFQLCRIFGTRDTSEILNPMRENGQLLGLIFAAKEINDLPYSVMVDSKVFTANTLDCLVT
jgi:hypothetical protein